MLYRNVIMAFLEYEGRVLLMRRGLHKRIAPGSWSGIAGHIEGEEIWDPSRTCLREIEEETALTPDQIEDLTLAYIIYNRLEEETVVNHLFFARVTSPRVEANDEGELHWIDKDQVPEKMEIPGLRLALKDYYSQPFKQVRLAVARGEKPYLLWLDL